MTQPANTEQADMGFTATPRKVFPILVERMKEDFVFSTEIELLHLSCNKGRVSISKQPSGHYYLSCQRCSVSTAIDSFTEIAATAVDGLQRVVKARDGYDFDLVEIEQNPNTDLGKRIFILWVQPVNEDKKEDLEYLGDLNIKHGNCGGGKVQARASSTTNASFSCQRCNQYIVVDDHSDLYATAIDGESRTLKILIPASEIKRVTVLKPKL